MKAATKLILGTVFLLIALYALATAVVPPWRRAGIRRPFSGVRYGLLTSLGLACTFGALGLGQWLYTVAPQLDPWWLFVPAVVGFVLVIADAVLDVRRAFLEIRRDLAGRGRTPTSSGRGDATPSDGPPHD